MISKSAIFGAGVSTQLKGCTPIFEKTSTQMEQLRGGYMADWDGRFMELARHVGTWSKDRSRQVGCVVVGPDNSVRAIGFNGFPRGLDDENEHRHQRPAKYLWTEHAERNA